VNMKDKETIRANENVVNVLENGQLDKKDKENILEGVQLILERALTQLLALRMDLQNESILLSILKSVREVKVCAEALSSKHLTAHINEVELFIATIHAGKFTLTSDLADCLFSNLNSVRRLAEHMHRE